MVYKANLFYELMVPCDGHRFCVQYIFGIQRKRREI